MRLLDRRAGYGMPETEQSSEQLESFDLGVFLCGPVRFLVDL